MVSAAKQQQVSTKGWNWGFYEMKDDEMEFKVDGERCFGIKYKDIAISSANGKNEVALEFTQDAEEANKGGQGDILCEMRFHVPNNELEIYKEQKEAKRKEDKKKQKEAAKKTNTEDKKQDDESDSQDYTDEGEEMTASKLFNAKIHEKANMDEFSGEIVCSIQDLPMLIPKGNYSLDFYPNFARLHGKTRDYKINFKDINQIIMLEKPDGIHMVYILQLNTPLRQGLTMHHFVAFNFEVDREQNVTIKLSPEQIKAKYGEGLNPEIVGKLYDVLSTLFMKLVNIKRIIMPGEFKSSRDTKAIKCTVRAAEGYLYPMKSSVIFIHKPVMYIKHSDIKCVQFSRVGHGAAGLSRSFDITLLKNTEGQQVMFQGIDKEEVDCLKNYFKQSGIKTRLIDELTRDQISSDSDGPAPGKVVDRGQGKRQIKTKDVNDIDQDMDDEEEEDEDFNDSGSGDSDSEEGEDDQYGEEDDENMEVDKAELKEISRNVDTNMGRGATRRKPGNK